MTLRFTDIEKWDDEWFLSLDNDSRVVWQYLIDKCSIGGCWKKNFQMLNFCCHVSWNEEKLVETFKDRLVDRTSYFFIPKFIKVQNPRGLLSQKPAVISIRRELESKGLDGIIAELFGSNYGTIKEKAKTVEGNTHDVAITEITTISEAEYGDLRVMFPKEDQLVRHLQVRGFDTAQAKGLAVEILNEQGAVKV